MITLILVESWKAQNCDDERYVQWISSKIQNVPKALRCGQIKGEEKTAANFDQPRLFPRFLTLRHTLSRKKCHPNIIRNEISLQRRDVDALHMSHRQEKHYPNGHRRISPYEKIKPHHDHPYSEINTSFCAFYSR